MNDTKNASVSPHRNPLRVLDLALRAAGTTIVLIESVPRKFKGLQDQVIRSASSVPANLAEGAGRAGRDRIHHYRIAYSSAKEVDVHLRILSGAGVIDQAKTDEAQELFDRVRAMTWRLIAAGIPRR